MLQKDYENIVETSERFIKDLNIPDIDTSSLIEKKKLSLSNLAASTNKQLEEYISVFGGYLVYVKLQLADLAARKGAIRSIYDEALSRKMSKLEQAYEAKRKPTKEALHGEAMESSDDLKQLQRQMIELETAAIRLEGIKDAYDTGYFAISRVVALRTKGVISGEN